MSDIVKSASEAVRRLRKHDLELKTINLIFYTQTDLMEMFDCLNTYPDIIEKLILNDIRLTPEIVSKLGQYLASSTTIEELTVNYNRFGIFPFNAILYGLRTNTSLRKLFIFGNRVEITNELRRQIDSMFVQVLTFNYDRPARSSWRLYSFGYTDIDFKRLKKRAKLLQHSSMQMVLINILNLSSRIGLN